MLIPHRSVLLAALLLPRSLAGQTSTDPALALQVDATALRPARYSYDLAMTREGLAQELGTQTISFTSATYAGAPSWLILEARSGVGIGGLDSLVASRDALTPLHWGASTGLARLAVEFARDSVYGATSSPLGRRSLVGSAPRGVIASEGMLDGLLRLAPLASRWTHDATLLVADVTGTRLVPVELTVEREEELSVPAGTFETWVVSLRADSTTKWLWVSKDERIVVKASQTLAQLSGAVVERVLTRIDDLTLLPAPAVPLPTDAASPGQKAQPPH